MISVLIQFCNHNCASFLCFATSKSLTGSIFAAVGDATAAFQAAVESKIHIAKKKGVEDEKTRVAERKLY